MAVCRPPEVGLCQEHCSASTDFLLTLSEKDLANGSTRSHQSAHTVRSSIAERAGLGLGEEVSSLNSVHDSLKALMRNCTCALMHVWAGALLKLSMHACMYVCMHVCSLHVCLDMYRQTDIHPHMHEWTSATRTHTETQRERERKQKAQVDANMHSTHYIALPLLLLTVHCLALLGAWPARLDSKYFLTLALSRLAQPPSLARWHGKAVSVPSGDQAASAPSVGSLGDDGLSTFVRRSCLS